MFYSHEVLTSRKYGVATVWVVATLGSKSALKKVSRKAILDVDVAKACDTIADPDAPMALRLQSSLLYGVARVYAQQCGYVLHDAETARNNMRALTRMMHQAGLEPEGVHKATASQLNLQDDPNFLPELDLMPLDLDDLNTNLRLEEETHSVLSPHNSQLTLGSQQTIGGLMIPSDGSMLGRSMHGLDLFGAQRGSGRVASIDPPQLLEDDLGLIIEPDGTMRMSEAPAREPRAPSGRADGTTPAPAGLIDFQQYGEALPPQPQMDDNEPMILPDDDVFGYGVTGDQEQQEAPTEEAAAPFPRKKRQAKTLPLDNNTTLRSTELRGWTRDYLARMNEQSRAKQASKLATLAKRNAEHWFLGAGSFLGQGRRGPLDIFTGAQLLETFTGVDILNPGKKRARADDSSQSGPQKRSRGEPSSEENARGLQYNDDAPTINDDVPIINDDTIEQGREAPTPLDDRNLSSVFPWNQSAGSRQPADAHPTSASFGGGPQLNLYSRRGSRLTSASPLVSRGSVALDVNNDFQLGGSDIAMSGLTGDEEFELYGPAAQVDTQTAAQSQWQRAALGAESADFLTFLQTAIDEADLAREEAEPGDDDDEALDDTVDFEAILPPQSNSQIVAAQALLHVLALGTKGLIKVAQDEHFGPINMRLVVAA